MMVKKESSCQFDDFVGKKKSQSAFIYIFFGTSTRAEQSEYKKDRVPKIRSTLNIALESLIDTVGIYQSSKLC